MPSKQKSTITMYVGAVVTGVLGVASLINNIMLFKNNVDMYTLQGYPVKEVLKQLIPAQLLPGVFEAIAIYGGITLILIAAGIINEKVSQCLVSSSNQQECKESVHKNESLGNAEEEKKDDVNEENKEIEDQPVTEQENKTEN